MSANLYAIDSWVQPIAEHLINGVILSAVIFLGSLLVFRLLFREQRWSASTRHRASLLLFFVLAGAPIVTALKPANNLPRVEQFSPQEFSVERIPPLLNANIPTDNSRSIHRWREPSFWLRWIDWPVAIAICWATLVVACLSRVALAINRLRVLHRSARPLTVSPKLASRRKITIAESSRISSPMAVGLWSPKVLLPESFESHFSAVDRENVLRHEIAHLDRFDDWLNLAQQLCIAFIPINPFLWILRQRLRLQEEIACDDWVLAGADHPKNYANLLARLAAAHQRGPLLASGVSRSGQQLYQRVSRILDKNSNRSLKASWRSTVLAGLSVIGVTVGALVWFPVIMWTAPAQALEAQNTPISQDDKPPALSSEVIMLLKNSALNDGDAGVRREAVNALANASGDEATSALLAVLNESKDEQVRLLILRRINRERVGEASVKEKLSDLASQEQSVPIRIAALGALARNIDDGVVEKFISIYRSSSEPPIKEACLRGLSGSQSKAAKDFLMSIAKDDPNPMMRRVALRAVSGPMGRRVIVRANRGMIDGMELNDLEYGPLGQVSDGFEETEPNLLDLPGNMIYLQKKAEPLTQRLEQLKQHAHAIPLPKFQDDQSGPPSDVPLPESPSKKPTDGQ